MEKYTYTPKDIKKIREIMDLSNRKFCRETGVNKGDLSRFMRGLKPLSDLNVRKIYEYEKANGLLVENKKSFFKRIVDFIKR